MDTRLQRLQRARLYLVSDDAPGGFFAAALAGGVEIVQLRAKQSSDRELIEAGRRLQALCEEHGALLIINDRPDLVAAIGADGVHIGQDDGSVRRARELVGEQRLVGVSTHTPAQIDAACADGADYIGVGPVHATPTKPGRPAVGVGLVAYAAANATVPFFAIGGIDAANAHEVLGAGGRAVAVVRALAEAPDPQAAATQLRAALERTEERVGAA